MHRWNGNRMDQNKEVIRNSTTHSRTPSNDMKQIRDGTNVELTAATEPFVMVTVWFWRLQSRRKEKGRSAILLLLGVSLDPWNNYHDSREETHRLAAGGFGRHVPVAHREEGDGHEPQGSVHFTRHFGGFPAGRTCRVSSRYEIVPELMDLVTPSHKDSVD